MSRPKTSYTPSGVRARTRGIRLPVLCLGLALCAPAQGEEFLFDEPDIDFRNDCTATVTIPVPKTGKSMPLQVEIAAGATYRRLDMAHPAWVEQAQVAVRSEEDRTVIEIRAENALPAHASMLVLSVATARSQPSFPIFEIPACDRTGTLYTTAYGDTLWDITRAHTRRAYDTNLWMLAILSYNRSAFVHDNANRLRSEVSLYLPSPAEVDRLGITVEEARTEMLRQHREWRSRTTSASGDSVLLHEKRLRIVPVPPRQVAREQATEQPPSAEARTEPAKNAVQNVAPVAPRPTISADNLLVTEEPAEDSVFWPLAQLDIPNALKALTDTTLERDEESSDTPRPWPWLPLLLAVASIFLLAWIARVLLYRKQEGNATEDDEVSPAATLDLARGYAEIGDRTRAEPLLRSVLEQGSEREQEEARDLLERMRDFPT